MSENDEKISIFGIRHHGPGSARSLLNGLRKLEPDCILIEGPPEANDLVKHVIHESMRPPVSLLIYAQDDLRRAVYYPFAIFSPEWQGLVYGARNNVPVRFMDLPQAHWLAFNKHAEEKLPQLVPDNEKDPVFDEDTYDSEGNGSDSVPDYEFQRIRHDPLSALAKVAGYDDSERWWENLVEHRREDLDVFSAINEAMTTLRSELSDEEIYSNEYEPLREAHMRQTIRAALKEGFSRIAVICGAWHVPALQKMPAAKEDQAKLKGLAKLKVESTWIPWTHARLSSASGYGAGVNSPGWYHHLWTCEDHVIERWLSIVARLLREEDLDASSAHIIEAVRLAETLASIRGQPLPGLAEISEAVQAVLCYGNDLPMRIIEEKLIVGEIMGEVPPDLPGTPLQKDFEKEQKRLRMPAQAGEKLYDLDLRNANDLLRSHLLHRMQILNIEWGAKQEVTGKSGSFHEVWTVRWMPDYALSIIEASIWGRSVADASSAFACDKSDKCTELSVLTQILDHVLLANLPAAVDHVMLRVQNEAAVAVDIKHLMAALPALVQIARYGNVRKTDIESVSKILDGLLSRICAGLPAACSALDEEAADEIFDLVLKVHSAVGLLQNDSQSKEWQETLQRIADAANVNGLLAGRACRLLFDRRIFDSTEAARRFGLALSTASEPALAASWADGFLRGSGSILVHDAALFDVVDQWVDALQDESFTQILPLLRRTFSSYTPPERRQIGSRAARAKASKTSIKKSVAQDDFDESRADRVLPVIGLLLGLPPLAVEDRA